MFIMLLFGTLVYIFSISMENILASLLSSVVRRSVIRWLDLQTLHVFGRYRWFCNIFVKCFLIHMSHIISN